jgi:hypothetical protein
VTGLLGPFVSMSVSAAFFPFLKQQLASDDAPINIIQSIVGEALRCLSASTICVDNTVDVRELGLSTAIVDAVVSLAVVPLLGNSVVSCFIPGGFTPPAGTGMDDAICVPDVLAKFLESRRITTGLQLDVAHIVGLLCTIIYDDDALMRSWQLTPVRQDVTAERPRLALLFRTVEGLLALPKGKERLLEKCVSEITAAVLFLDACPAVSGRFTPFESPATLFARAAGATASRAQIDPIFNRYNEICDALPVTSRLAGLLGLVNTKQTSPAWFQVLFAVCTQFDAQVSMPSFLQGACNRQLTCTIMSDGGVEALIVLSACNASDEQLPHAAAAVAAALKIVPVDFVSPHDYVRRQVSLL